jgi:hypothetical protein
MKRNLVDLKGRNSSNIGFFKSNLISKYKASLYSPGMAMRVPVC